MIYACNLVEEAPFECTAITWSSQVKIHSTDRLVCLIKKRMAGMTSDDYLFPSGNLVVNVICGLVQSVNMNKLKITTGNTRPNINYELDFKEMAFGVDLYSDPKVFLVDEQYHDYSGAEKFGKVQPILKDGSSFTSKTIFKTSEYVAENMGRRDFFILSGRKDVCMACCSTAMKKNGIVKTLIFDAKKKNYFLRDLERKAFLHE